MHSYFYYIELILSIINTLLQLLGWFCSSYKIANCELSSFPSPPNILAIWGSLCVHIHIGTI